MQVLSCFGQEGFYMNWLKSRHGQYKLLKEVRMYEYYRSVPARYGVELFNGKRQREL